jgi:DNA-binding response OmpR family regulator
MSAPHRASIAQPSGPHDAANTGIVLIVDDNESLQRVYGEILTTHGFETGHALDLAAAIATAESSRLRLVVLDLTLGAETGLDFLGWLRSRDEYVDTPVLVLTGAYDQAYSAATLFEMHRATLRHKPIGAAEFIACVNELVEGAGIAGRG